MSIGRRRRPLTSEDRAVIAALHAREVSYREIGRVIGRDVSVVSREVARNKGADGSYHGPVAHRAAHEARRRPKKVKLLENPGLCRRIEKWMDEGWSPGLIAEVLKVEARGRIMERVSAETIYQALYVQTRGQLRADLHRQLSLKRRQRKHRGTVDGRGKSIYAEAFTISQRPAEVADRAVPGHWEGDLIVGTANGSAIGTLVERSTRFTILLHLPGRHDAESVAAAMIREMGHLPEHLRRSITWDRGSELAEYADIQLQLKAPVYFCDPHSPWQRGTNENTNRLLRFWFEKGTDLSVHTAKDLRRVAATLNSRPRPTLDLQTPAERLKALLTKPAAA
jgi:transposase, IS30 family